MKHAQYFASPHSFRPAVPHSFRLPTLPTHAQDLWPEDDESRAKIRGDYAADAPAELVGDRRQEIVFIGQASALGIRCA